MSYYHMTDLRIRNLDDDVVAQLKDRARMNGRSLENELREALTELATRPQRELAARAAKLRASIRAESGVLTESAPYIRDERDRRG
jgi:plasmid stability protein